ncbi:MAG: PEP-CTERM sorting domain-containing protein [Candidatus Omnitrophota bacterium]
MKKGLICLAILLGVGMFLSMQTTASAWIEITDPLLIGGIVYAPGSNLPGEPLTTVVVAPTGSVTIGSFALEGDSQPIGWKGIGVPLAPLGYAPGYQFAFDDSFLTWDSSYYDEFYGVLTQGDYIWNGGLVLGGFTFGGLTEGGLEGINNPWQMQGSFLVDPNYDYFLNIVLRTSYDEQLPSWGLFSDVSVQVIPEPATLSLLGFGVLGLFGLRRKKS